jgi:outer membrane lipoprotein carrier protein
MGFRAAAIVLAGAVLAASGVEVQGADPTAPELAEALQRKYDGIRDFSADFVHTYRGGVLKRQLSESGTLLVKKPGKTRWEYKVPEQKLFVSDGVKIYYYIPEDKQVIVSDMPSGDRAATPALFLAGKRHVTRDFTPTLETLPPGMPAGSRVLKLVPKVPQQDYDWLILALDPTTLALRGLVTGDAQGGTSSFTFSNLKENVGVTDRSFAFNAPRGVDVITSPR